MFIEVLNQLIFPGSSTFYHVFMESLSFSPLEISTEYVELLIARQKLRMQKWSADQKQISAVADGWGCMKPTKDQRWEYGTGKS